MKATFKQLNEVINTIQGLMNKNKDFSETKLGYSCKRFEEINTAKIFRQYHNELLKIRVNNALTDKTTGALLKDPGSIRTFQYGPEGLLAVVEAEQALDDEWDKKEFDVEPYVCLPANLPKDLTSREKTLLKGFVL